MPRKIKEAIALAFVIAGLVYAYGEYRNDQNQSFPINNHYFLLGFDKNISQVKSVDMDLNYDEKSFKFQSEFIPSAKDIVIGVDPINFNKNNICNVNLFELDSVGNKKQEWTVTPGVILFKQTITNDPKNTTLLLDGTCLFNYTIPNGNVRTEISNFYKPQIVGNTTFKVSFDKSKFGCRENCLYNPQFSVVDDDSPFNLHYVKMRASNIDTSNLQFEIRTFNKEKANSENFWLLIFIGVLFLAFQIGYDIYKEISLSNLFIKKFNRFKDYSAQRIPEKTNSVPAKTYDEFSNKNWNQFVIIFWTFMIILVVALTIASWNTPESIPSKIGAIFSVLALFVAVYIAVWTVKTESTKKREILEKTNYAKEKIYSTLRAIEENRKLRERIRTMNPRERPDVDLQTEIRFMNRKLQRVIESLPFVLSLHSEYLPSKFVFRVNDAINGYDFILNRLDVLPLENDDPKKVLSGDIERFIEELKKIE